MPSPNLSAARSYGKYPPSPARAFHPLEQRAVGDARRGEDAVALGQFGQIVLAMVEGETHGTDADAGDYLIPSGDAAHIGEGEAE